MKNIESVLSNSVVVLNISSNFSTCCVRKDRQLLEAISTMTLVSLVPLDNASECPWIDLFWRFISTYYVF